MTRKTLPFLCLFLFVDFFASMAQEPAQVLRGRVIDSAENRALEYVTVNINTDSSAIKSILTDAKGEFELTGLAHGKYTATFVAVGYEPKELPFELLGDAPKLDLGDIRLSAGAQALDEVVVTANRPIVKQDIDRLTYDV